MTVWTHIGPTVLAAFLASLVECVEALTVVLAVGTVRGWRWALAGSAAAVTALLLLVAALGGSVSRIPLAWVRLCVGTLLLLFGLRWLRKAILRSAGAIALHDETQAYARATARLGAAGGSSKGVWDPVAFAASFKIVMLEGIEVVFIVVALAANNRRLWPATLGALGALLTVVLLGVTLHRPLARIPENLLKFAVGVLLAAFGTFWIGEALRLPWPGGDAAVPILVASYLLCALALAAVCRRWLRRSGGRRAAISAGPRAPAGALRLAAGEVAALFVDDRSLAVGIVGWVTLAYVCALRAPPVSALSCGVFVLGIAILLAVSTSRAAAPRR